MYYKGKVKYFIWARKMLCGQKLRAFFCAPGKICLLVYPKANLSLHLPTLKFLSPIPKFICIYNSTIDVKKKSFICSSLGP